MPPAVIGGLLVIHGLITSAIGFGAVTNPHAPAMAMPGFGWWPGPFGRSWAFDALHLGTPAALLGGTIWLLAGLALIGGGLGWLGAPGLAEARYLLLVGGSALGLVALALYFHPVYLLAIGINVAIVLLLSGLVTTS